MNLRPPALAALLAATFVSLGADAPPPPPEQINVHNRTGHEALVFLFEGNEVRNTEAGGTQVAFLKDGESAVLSVPRCQFGIMLVDHADTWFTAYSDCATLDVTFLPDTGHGKKPG